MNLANIINFDFFRVELLICYGVFILLVALLLFNRNLFKMGVSVAIFIMVVTFTSKWWGPYWETLNTVEASSSVATSTVARSSPPTPHTAVVPEEKTSTEPTTAEGGMAPDESETTAGPIATEPESSVFDLGSNTEIVAGVFDDDVPYKLYTIKRGDTIYSLSRDNGVTQSDLLERNDLRIGDSLRIGRELMIPIPPD